MNISLNLQEKITKRCNSVFQYLENKLGGENPAMCCGENGAE